MDDNKLYSGAFLDENYKHLFDSKCKEIQKKYSKKELELISFNDLVLMGKYLISLKPVSRTREYKVIILRYLDVYIEYNKPLEENKLFIHENVKNYLYKVSGYLLKYGFSYKSSYRLTMFIITVFEMVVIYFVDVELYKLPYISFLLFFYLILSQERKRKQGKLLDLW